MTHRHSFILLYNSADGNALIKFHKNCVDEQLNIKTTKQTICETHITTKTITAGLNSLNTQFEGLEKHIVLQLRFGKKKTSKSTIEIEKWRSN